MRDTYWAEPQAPYEQRRQLYLAYCASHSPGGRTGFFSQLARLEMGSEPVDEEPIREAVAYVDSRQDCDDFSVGGLLRILYLYRDSPLIPRDLIAEIEACLLRFKYWWDEPGDDRRCYHTENHQIIFHSDELLAGQFFVDRCFANSGKTGQYHIDHALHLIRRWLDFRIRFGFSEWLSNCYFEEDLLALVNLHDFAEPADIRDRAKLLIDLLLYEMALHTYRGVFGCTHGRTYARLIKGAREEDSASTAKLMLGMGLFNKPDALGAVPLATSTYRCPPILEAIANDLKEPLLCKERHSIDIDDAPQFGLDYDDIEDGHLYWSIQDYLHPQVFPLSKRMSELYGVRLHEDYEQRYKELYQWQVDQYGRIVDPNLDCHALTEVHVQTYRTPSYLLSCAQDYRPGKPGYQQHIWQATLGIDAVIFTNHPGSQDEVSRPNYWAGNGVLPRAAQHENVLICIHHIPPRDRFPFVHAFMPHAMFDEVVEQDNWILARKGTGFVALQVQHPHRWLQDEKERVVELRVDSPDSVWVCELGEQAQWGDFASFVQAITKAPLRFDGLNACYESPSLGSVSFGWQGPLEVAGHAVALHDYPRFDNPYTRTAFAARQVAIRRHGEELMLDFERNESIHRPN